MDKTDTFEGGVNRTMDLLEEYKEKRDLREHVLQMVIINLLLIVAILGILFFYLSHSECMYIR